ncbi:hypothetical protein ARMGADRAFT_1034256 [Armillaria gallica]|uniref:Uncharacterized protein n=1 Tax=Armillaria gallica TaxID=47427 RepID=A0A2H3DAR7_ARMGA|nr:hypothetical protein ARMGADRAFT_1034256 [Armillaria gallica]
MAAEQDDERRETGESRKEDKEKPEPWGKDATESVWAMDLSAKLEPMPANSSFAALTFVLSESLQQFLRHTKQSIVLPKLVWAEGLEIVRGASQASSSLVLVWSPASLLPFNNIENVVAEKTGMKSTRWSTMRFLYRWVLTALTGNHHPVLDDVDTADKQPQYRVADNSISGAVDDTSNPMVRVVGEELGAIGSERIEVQCTKKMVEWVVHVHGNVWVTGVGEFSARRVHYQYGDGDGGSLKSAAYSLEEHRKRGRGCLVTGIVRTWHGNKIHYRIQYRYIPDDMRKVKGLPWKITPSPTPAEDVGGAIEPVVDGWLLVYMSACQSDRLDARSMVKTQTMDRLHRLQYTQYTRTCCVKFDISVFDQTPRDAGRGHATTDQILHIGKIPAHNLQGWRYNRDINVMSSGSKAYIKYERTYAPGMEDEGEGHALTIDSQYVNIRSNNTREKTCRVDRGGSFKVKPDYVYRYGGTENNIKFNPGQNQY